MNKYIKRKYIYNLLDSGLSVFAGLELAESARVTCFGHYCQVYVQLSTPASMFCFDCFDPDGSDFC